MAVLLEGSLEFFQSDHRVLGHLPEVSSRKSLGGSKLVPFMNDGHCVLGNFNAAEMFCYPSPDLCLETFLTRSSTDNYFDLIGWFLL